jgi:hypothetical protein
MNILGFSPIASSLPSASSFEREGIVVLQSACTMNHSQLTSQQIKNAMQLTKEKWLTAVNANLKIEKVTANHANK